MNLLQRILPGLKWPGGSWPRSERPQSRRCWPTTFCSFQHSTFSFRRPLHKRVCCRCSGPKVTTSCLVWWCQRDEVPPRLGRHDGRDNRRSELSSHHLYPSSDASDTELSYIILSISARGTCVKTFKASFYYINIDSLSRAKTVCISCF